MRDYIDFCESAKCISDNEFILALIYTLINSLDEESKEFVFKNLKEEE